MSKKEVGPLRQPRPQPSYSNVDLTKPLKMNNFVTAGGDCFGELWDITHKQCSVCSDNAICGIVTGHNARQMAQQMHKIKTYLDVSERDCVDVDTDKLLHDFKPRLVAELIDKVMERSKTTVEIAVKEW